MKTHYYCQNCDVFFWDEKEPPNINRVHTKCGLRVKIITHIEKRKKEEE